MSKVLVSWGAVCLVSSLSTLAAAQTGDRAVAEALFRSGREALGKGDHATACQRFEESNRLEPAVGTVFNLANCREKLGQLAAAWQRYQEAVQKLPSGDERIQIASQRAAALEPRLSKLSLFLPEDAPPGTVVLKDGTELGSGSLGVALPVDPGEHKLIVRAPGYEDAETVISLAEAEKRELALSLGARKSDLPDAREGSSIGFVNPSAADADAGDAPSSSQRTLGFVVGGVGVAGLAVSLATGAMVLSKKSTVDDECENKRCTPEGLDAGDSGRTLSTISTVSFAVGLAGIGTGLVLILTSDGSSGAQTSISASPLHGGAGLRFGGRF
ncbi:MAG TPA: PEGA domain-containing protein [Polyangiaceae bacterium]|nr:PEGA domain-containing protein [Polyangiaceae bacterium]